MARGAAARRSTWPPTSPTPTRRPRRCRRGNVPRRPGRSRPRAGRPLHPANASSSRSPRPAARRRSQPGDVVVVTGGARGVTAEVAVALAEAFRPTLVLLGRSPAPEREPDWLAPLTDEAEIKRELGRRANGDATPKLIGEQYRQLAAQREMRADARRASRRPAARAVYRTVDVRDAAAVADVLRRRARASSARCAAWSTAPACWPTPASRTRPPSSSTASTAPRSTACARCSPALTPDDLRAAGAVLVVHGPLRPDGAGRLRHRQRGAEQARPSSTPAGCRAAASSRSTGGRGTAAW